MSLLLFSTLLSILLLPPAYILYDVIIFACATTVIFYSAITFLCPCFYFLHCFHLSLGKRYLFLDCYILCHCNLFCINSAFYFTDSFWVWLLVVVQNRGAKGTTAGDGVRKLGAVCIRPYHQGGGHIQYGGGAQHPQSDLEVFPKPGRLVPVVQDRVEELPLLI